MHIFGKHVMNWQIKTRTNLCTMYACSGKSTLRFIQTYGELTANKSRQAEECGAHTAGLESKTAILHCHCYVLHLRLLNDGNFCALLRINYRVIACMSKIPSRRPSMLCIYRHWTLFQYSAILLCIVANVGVVTQARGSAYIEMGQTKVICAV